MGLYTLYCIMGLYTFLSASTLWECQMRHSEKINLETNCKVSGRDGCLIGTVSWKEKDFTCALQPQSRAPRPRECSLSSWVLNFAHSSNERESTEEPSAPHCQLTDTLSGLGSLSFWKCSHTWPPIEKQIITDEINSEQLLKSNRNN